MKTFLRKFILGFSIMCIIAVVPMVIAICITMHHIKGSTLPSHEKILFMGDSITGCTIAEYPNDDYGVYWRSSTPPVFNLAMLREWERMKRLRSVRMCVIGIGYHSISSCSTSILQYINLQLFGLTWRHRDLFPKEVFYSFKYLLARNYLLTKAPFTEVPPTMGTPVHLQPKAIQEKIYQDVATYQNVNIASYQANAVRLRNTFLEMNALCKRNGIQLVVLFTPHISKLNHGIPDPLNDVCNGLLRQLSENGITTFDCRNTIADAYFRDCVHLLPAGAERFTPPFLEKLRMMCK